MRRIILVVTVALVMAAMLVAALPALAAPPANKPGQYTCYKNGQYYYNVPQGQTALYDFCYPNQR
jgi:hypothetical protein